MQSRSATESELQMKGVNWFEEAFKLDNEDDRRQVAEAEVVKQLLIYCGVTCGAKVTISVEHDDGHKATLTTFDHAALVSSLIDALEYFQSEMIC